MPPPPSGDRGRGRRGVFVLLGLVLLLAAVGATGAYLYFNGRGVAFGPTPTPLPSVSSQPSATTSPSLGLSPTPEPISQTPFPETPVPDPTPRPGDKFQGYEVTVLEGENTLFEVDDAGNIVRSEIAHYDRFSKAPVDRVVAANGLLHWRTSAGFFIGLSYIHDRSGPFLIRAVYEGADGEQRYIVLPDDEI